MGFTKRALEEQKFLKEKYPVLYKYYDEYLGYICIPSGAFYDDADVKREVFRIIGEKNEYSRYVMYRDLIFGENGEEIWGFVVCAEDFVSY